MGSYGQHSAATAAAGVVSTASYVAVPLSPPSGNPNDSASAPTMFRVTGGGPVSFVCNNIGANSIDVKVQGSNDGLAASWGDITTTELTGIGASAAKAHQILACGYLWLQVLVKDTAGGSHGTLVATINQNSVS